MAQASKTVKRVATVRSLDKALFILDLIGTKNASIDLASLAREARMPKTTTLRMLNTLVRRNFLSYDPATKTYSLGISLIYLGKKAEEQFNLTRILRPFLVEISNEVQETVSLVLLDYDTAVYIDQIISKNLIRAVPSIGSHLQLYCTASGKMFLSEFDEEELEDYLQTHPLHPLTPKTITDPLQLRKELLQIKQQGYSIDNEETELGGFCIAVPVRNQTGRLTAVFSITGPAERIRSKNLERLTSYLKSISQKASETLGYKASPSQSIQ